MDPVVVPPISNEDQSTSTAVTPVTQQIGQTAQDASQVVVGGAFGGTLPIPESSKKVSDTMPAFSFDEDDFSTEENKFPTNPVTPVSPSVVEDPFAGGFTSLQNESETPTEPEGTISLDSLEQNDIQTTTAETFTDFQIPTPENTIEATTTETPLSPESESPSFDFPEENTATETMATEEAMHDEISLPEAEEITDTNPEMDIDVPMTEESVEDTTSSDSFDLPSEETTEPQDSIMEDMTVEDTSDKNENIPDTTLPQADEIIIPDNESTASEEENNTIPTFDFPNEVTEDTPSSESTTDLTEMEEENEIINDENKDDDPITNAVDEQRDTKSHALTEDFEEFEKAFKEYTSFKNKKRIELVGLRTDDDEVIYSFDQIDNTINITKSNTSDVISFNHTESGLQVTLNNESIAYYGVDDADRDTTHYLKEKLGKFTMMLESELAKEKKAKEQSKKLKETLRSF